LLWVSTIFLPISVSEDLTRYNQTSTLQVITLDAKIQVDFNPDVVAYYSLIGHENRDVSRWLLFNNSMDFRNGDIDACEIGATNLASGTVPPPCTWSPSARMSMVASSPCS
jgi:hypothetical protein